MEQISVSISDQERESHAAGGVDALVLAMMPKSDQAHVLIAGSPEALHPLLVASLINWPMYTPLDGTECVLLEALLTASPLIDFERLNIGVLDHEAAAALGVAIDGTHAQGALRYRITVHEGDATATFLGKAYLLFVEIASVRRIGRTGSGHEKYLMMEQMIERLWGEEVFASAQEILQGDIPEEFRRTVREMREKSVDQDPEKNPDTSEHEE